ncbi:MAG: YlxR family protein [Clostridia bacterium]|nr:YlxR family protein [Clostridia bacterium]
MNKKVPMRTCVACKSVKPKKELVRIVKDAEGISVDFSGRKNGRGAYVCNDSACAEKLKKQKILSKVFSCQVDDSVYDGIREALSGNDKKSV